MSESKKNIEIKISKDKMDCSIVIKGLEEGMTLTFGEVKELLEKENIIFGVKDYLINIMLRELKINKKYKIAEGIPPEKGKDGYIDFKFDISAKTLKPKVLENGKVDYRDLNIIKKASKGDILLEVIPPTKGENGTNVFGNTVEGIWGKEIKKIPKGKNTIFSEEDKRLISNADGQIVHTKERVNVEEVLEISGDVGVGTGNINFTGSVIIKGNIMSDFSVKATGNIEVFGAIEGGEVYSGGNIFSSKGIIGMLKSNIYSEGNITAKTIQDANIFAKGDIISDGIMHCDIKCEGMIELKGKKGLFVGGKTSVVNGLKANIIGSPMGTVTEIYLGPDTYILAENIKYTTELCKLKGEYEGYLKSLQSILKLKIGTNIPKDKKRSFLNLINITKDMKKRIIELEEKVEKSKLVIDNEEIKNLYIEVEKRIYPGVVIKIGNASKTITDEHEKCKIRNVDDVIKIY